MDPAFWQRVEAITLAALDRSPDERALYLSQACGGDAELRREVEAQLSALEEDPGFLETPIARVSALPEADVAGESLDARYVGPYRLVRPIEHGGMGEVYLAVHEAEDFRQTVAVKLIRAGLDTEEVVSRFRLERQILASLRHPNIAQLIDGGATEDGRPYFVMEYVEGVPLDEYCDRHRLSVRQRLELFQVICAAVQHAHQNLVVHRDLKPSNILVTGDGAPKLLDFGIGKVLAPSSALDAAVKTRTQVRLLTPEYASPEQIQGGAITTASDVCALGVLLYELLTGHHPFARADQSVEDLERAVCEADPSRPSTAVGRAAIRRRRNGTTETLTPEAVSAARAAEPGRLRRRLAGDLDNIVLMALRKEPARRYPSATALAEDIQRHLDGLPVRARPDTLAYRAEKFLRRHAWAAATVATAFFALAATSIVTLVQSRRVVAERDKALEVRSFLMEMFGATGAERAVADTLTVRRLLDLQAARLDQTYGDRPQLRAEMLEVLADGYDRLGLYREAEPLARQALELRRRVLGDRHPDVASSLNLLGWVLHERGSSEEAIPPLREAVAIRRAAGRRYRLDLSRSLNDLGVTLERRGNYQEAEGLYREALGIRATLLGDEHRSVGITANNLATVLYHQGKYREAIPVGERALRALRAELGPDHQRSVIAQANLAAFKVAAGELASAEDEYRDLLERQRRLQGPNHPMTAVQLTNLASVLNRVGKYDEAERLAREALAIREAALGPTHPEVAASLSVLARALAGQDEFDQALGLFRRALGIRRAAHGPAHPRVAAVLADLGNLHARMDQPVEAERHLREALAMYESSPGPGTASATAVRVRLARLLLDGSRPAEALAVLDKAPAEARDHRIYLAMAEAHIALGNNAVAESLLTATQGVLDSGGGDEAMRGVLAHLRAVLVSRSDLNKR